MKLPIVGINIMLFKDNKILLGLRADDKEKREQGVHGPNQWMMCGGKLEMGESFEECARREMLEENGMQIGELKLISLANTINGDFQCASIGFLCEEFTGEPQVLEPHAITDWQWFDLDNLPENLFMPTRQIIDNYQKGELYTHD